MGTSLRGRRGREGDSTIIYKMANLSRRLSERTAISVDAERIRKLFEQNYPKDHLPRLRRPPFILAALLRKTAVVEWVFVASQPLQPWNIMAHTYIRLEDNSTMTLICFKLFSKCHLRFHRHRSVWIMLKADVCSLLPSKRCMSLGSLRSYKKRFGKFTLQITINDNTPQSQSYSETSIIFISHT